MERAEYRGQRGTTRKKRQVEENKKTGGLYRNLTTKFGRGSDHSGIKKKRQGSQQIRINIRFARKTGFRKSQETLEGSGGGERNHILEDLAGE